MEPASEESPTAPRAGWRRWVPLALGAAALLVASQLLWLWQTWPVRHLLALDALLNGSSR